MTTSMSTAYGLIVKGLVDGAYSLDPDSDKAIEQNKEHLDVMLRLVEQLSINLFDSRRRKQMFTVGDAVLKAFDQGKDPETIAKYIERQLNR